MLSKEYREKSYTLEKNYLEPWEIATKVKQNETILRLLIEEIATEFSGLSRMYKMNYTGTMTANIDALYTVLWNIGDIAEELDALESKPEKGEQECTQ